MTDSLSVTVFVYSLCSAFPGLLSQFMSVMYLRWTHGKRLDKNGMRMRALLFENVSRALFCKHTAGNYGFKTLVNICKIVDWLLPTLKSHWNDIQNPVKILNSAPSIFHHSKLNIAMHWNLFTIWVVKLRAQILP